MFEHPNRTGVLAMAVALMALVAVGVAAVGLWLTSPGRTSQRETRGPHQLDTAVLDQAVRRAATSKSTLDLHEVVPGDWDRVLTFGGYSTGATVTNRLGFDWGEGFENTEIAHEAEGALVFMNDRKVVAWIAHFDRADLACVARRAGRKRAMTRFYAESPEPDYVLLVPAEDGRDGAAARARRRKVSNI